MQAIDIDFEVEALKKVEPLMPPSWRNNTGDHILKWGCATNFALMRLIGDKLPDDYAAIVREAYAVFSGRYTL